MLEQCDDASVQSVKKRNQDVGDTNYSVYPCKAKRTQFVITLVHLFRFSALEIMLYLKLSQGKGVSSWNLSSWFFLAAGFSCVGEPHALLLARQDLLLPLAVCQEWWTVLPAVPLGSPSTTRVAGAEWGPKSRGCRKLQERCPSHLLPKP